MKKLLVLLLTIFALNSCEKDAEIIGIDAEKKMPKVDVCHKGKIINISKNALKAHLNHGDVQLIDEDGDGYVTLENECLPYSDCDDSDADINPAMEEICGDGIDNNCNGEIDEGCEERKTYIPDDIFEQFLRDCGYDDVLDDYVLTSNIQSITEMHLPYDSGIGSINGTNCGSPNGELLDLTGIEDFISLEFLSFGGTLHTLLNFESLINLKELRMKEPFVLSDLNLSSNLELTNLTIIGQSNITSLDLTNNSKLKSLNFLTYAGSTPISNLDLSMNIALETLIVEFVPVTFLDLSNNINLTRVEIISNMELTGLNIKNDHNTLITIFQVNAPNLSCVQVDVVDYSNTHWELHPDFSGAYFSEDCGY